MRDELTVTAVSNVAQQRSACAEGKATEGVAFVRRNGGTTLPDAVDLCVAAMTRLARDGGMRFLSSPDGSVTPALALDTGFVAGYRKGGESAGVPAMAALRGTAERCLAKTATDNNLCYSVGYAYGVRTAAGETIDAR